MTTTAVIVPVLGRPQNAAPFMASLRATAKTATVYAIHDAKDTETADAWATAGATLLDVNDHRELNRPGTFSEKVNVGYLRTDEPWLFITGDDVRFTVGWLSNAQLVASRYYHVVGTNDLGNPRVMAGQHATHLLIRREYVDECGASWDGPKVVCHEGYAHNYVDDEIVMVAKQRGAWLMALSSVVEHLHPWFGKSDEDWVYKLGQESADADRWKFERRLKDNLR